MGIQILNLRMKVFLAVLFCGAALALPNGRSLRPEEHWRPAAARDLSKFTPRHALVQAKSSPVEHEFVTLARSIRSSKLSKSTHKTSSVDLAAECGIEGPPAQDKIVGGFEAAENQWPWQVALFIDNAWFCGGALISENYVMTAAHCADGASYFDIMAGAHNVRASSEPHRIEITSFEGQTHPEWDSNSLYADIALVHLPEKVAFSEFIRPSCLPPASDANEQYVGQLTTPVGWGKNADSAGGITPDLNMVSDLPVITRDSCADYYGGIIYSGIMCIDAAGGKGVCNGDSGGTLNIRQSEGGNKWTQVGVTSFVSSAGCESGNPHGFSRVAEHLQWIETVTGLSLT